MDTEIKERINTIRQGKIPRGYRYVKDIGMAPIDWKIGKLFDVVVNKQRPVPKPKTPYWRLGIRSWAKGTFHSFVDKPETVSMDELYEVHQNDLVVNITFAWEHAIAIASEKDHGLLVSHRFPTYVFKDKYIPKYYEAVVKQRSFKDMLEHISPGGAGRNRVLNRKDFLNLPCYIPSFDEQEKIAEILSACDKVIELKEKLIEEKKRQKKWLMYEFFKNKKYIKSHWENFSVRDLGEVITGTTPQKSIDEYWNGDFLWVTSQDFKEKYICNSRNRLSEKGKRQVQVIPAGAVLVTCIASIGLNAITTIECATNQQINAVVCNHKCNNEFFYYLIEFNKHLLQRLAGKTAVPIISKEQFQAMKFYIPIDLNEQKKVANILCNLDKELEIEFKELNEWKRKKKALTQLLLTGIVRVNKE